MVCQISVKHFLFGYREKSTPGQYQYYTYIKFPKYRGDMLFIIIYYILYMKPLISECYPFFTQIAIKNRYKEANLSFLRNQKWGSFIVLLSL